MSSKCNVHCKPPTAGAGFLHQLIRSRPSHSLAHYAHHTHHARYHHAHHHHARHHHAHHHHAHHHEVVDHLNHEVVDHLNRQEVNSDRNNLMMI